MVACDQERMTSQDLAQQIDRLIREHIAAIRRAAAAVEKAFAAAAREPDRKPQRAHARLVAGASTKVRAAPRRPPDDIAELGEKFYVALRAAPGETMLTLAPVVGASPRALQVVVARLERANRVRSVGQRQHTRYFPMSAAATASRGQRLLVTRPRSPEEVAHEIRGLRDGRTGISSIGRTIATSTSRGGDATRALRVRAARARPRLRPPRPPAPIRCPTCFA